MKTTLYTLAFLLLLAVVPMKAQAQGSYVSFGYRIAFPMASFSKYIKATSFRGVQFDYKYFVNDNLAVGFQYNWNGYYENKPRQTYENEKGAITGSQYNFSYANNLLVGADYYFTTNTIVKPFLGARLGSAYLEIDRFVGAIQMSDTQWKFSYSATAGALFQIPNTSLAFTLEGSWNQVVYDNVHYNSLSNIGLFIGFCYSGQFKDM